jgi:hypothetical protein
MAGRPSCWSFGPSAGEAPVSFGRSLARLPTEARKELLMLLTSPSHVRADVIRQFHERGTSDIVELLIMCEEDDLKRATMIEALRSLSI